MGASRLSFRLRLGILIRSLAVQGSWSFRSMQQLGFFFVLAPHLARRAPDPGAALRREMAFFNTHPVMSCYLAGVVARLEQEGRGEAALAARAALMGPLGAVGDSFFWATLRPLAVLAGAAVALMNLWAGAAVLLLAWNVPALWTRWILIGAGWDHADDPAEGIVERAQEAWPGRLAPLVPVLAAFLLGLAGAVFRGLLPAAIIFAASLLLFSRGWKTGRVLVAMLAACASLGWAAQRIAERMGIAWSPWR
jgi:PTS system mannose-specific IID component